MSNEGKRIGLPLQNEPRAEATPPAPEGQQPPAPPGGAELTAEQVGDIEKQVVGALETCFDPEIPVNIYELGLIYNIDVSPTGLVHVKMTLTSPACPAAGSLPPEVRNKVKAIPGVADAQVEVVWEPPWHQGLMSDAARLQLGLDY